MKKLSGGCADEEDEKMNLSFFSLYVYIHALLKKQKKVANPGVISIHEKGIPEKEKRMKILT